MKEKIKFKDLNNKLKWIVIYGYVAATISAIYFILVILGLMKI